MKRLLFIIFLLFFALSCSPSGRLEELDRVLKDAPEYERAFHRKIDSLKACLETAESDSVRFRTAWNISELYKVYNIDTCLIFARMMLKDARSEKESILARSALVYALVCSGKDKEALDIYHSIPTDIVYDEDLRIYYEGVNHLFWTLSELHPELEDSCRVMRRKNRQELLRYDSTSYFGMTYLIHEQNARKQYDQAEQTARKILAMTDIPVRYRAINEHNLGLLKRKQGQDDEAVEHFTRAAILDLKSATKEYNSLYHLAKILHKRGDNERACQYMIRTVNDAIFCNYYSHYTRSAQAVQMLHQSFLMEAAQDKRHLGELVSILVLLLAGTFSLLVIRYRFYQRERESNERIRIANIHLKDSSRIQDNILSAFMEKSAYYIRKVDETKSEMRRAYRHEGLDALLKILRSPAYSDTEFKIYFREFDESILHLFPRFVDEANALMNPAHPLPLDRNGSFSTELRILALIRLGITDSSAIAKALNISVGTTYTYRYQMRRHALCPSEDFEKRIREIGLDS